MTRVRVSQSHGLLGRMLSFPVLLVAVLLASVYLLVPRSMADPDIWWHLRDAQYQLLTHSFLRRDIYSFTASGTPWMNHEWLAELPFYLGWHLLGSRGLFLVTVAAIESIFLGVYALAWLHSKSIKAALVVTLVAAFLSTVSFGPRTLLFGWICLVAELVLLEGCIRSRPHAFARAGWLLPALFLVWVNTHGSWLIGLVVLLAVVGSGWVPIHRGAIESAGWTLAQKHALSWATLFSIAALFVNPYGWRLVAYPFDLAFRQKLNIANVEEWATLNFHTPRAHLLLVALALLFSSQLVRRRVWAPYELAFLFLGVYASFTYSRFLFLAAILLAPIFATELSALAPYRAAANKPWLNALILGGLVILVVRHFPALHEAQASEDKAFPEQALPFLRTFHPRGNVLNEFLWGGFLEWHARQIPVLIDSRVDIFEYKGVLKDYLDAMRLQNTFAILDKYQIRYVLFEQDAPLTYLLEHTPGWKVDYRDGATVLLERATSVGR